MKELLLLPLFAFIPAVVQSATLVSPQNDAVQLSTAQGGAQHRPHLAWDRTPHPVHLDAVFGMSTALASHSLTLREAWLQPLDPAPLTELASVVSQPATLRFQITYDLNRNLVAPRRSVPNARTATVVEVVLPSSFVSMISAFILLVLKSDAFRRRPSNTYRRALDSMWGWAYPCRAALRFSSSFSRNPSVVSHR